MTSEPALHERLTGALRSGRAELFGVDQEWIAPVAAYEAPHGFGEESWVEHIPENTIAWILSGADVHCRSGRRKGLRVARSQRTLTVHAKGAAGFYTADGGIRFAHFVIPDGLLHRVMDELRPSSRRNDAVREDLVGIDDGLLFRGVNEYLIRAEDRLSPPSRIEMEARALLIVERLIRVHHLRTGQRLQGGLPPRVLARVCDFMLSQLSREVSLAELAALAQLSPFHFCRAFKQSTGEPPHAWLTERRIERAKEMMASHAEIGLLEIALAVGYESQTAFGVAFKRRTGVTPGQWRRSI